MIKKSNTHKFPTWGGRSARKGKFPTFNYCWFLKSSLKLSIIFAAHKVMKSFSLKTVSTSSAPTIFGIGTDNYFKLELCFAGTITLQVSKKTLKSSLLSIFLPSKRSQDVQMLSVCQSLRELKRAQESIRVEVFCMFF